MRSRIRKGKKPRKGMTSGKVPLRVVSACSIGELWDVSYTLDFFPDWDKRAGLSYPWYVILVHATTWINLEGIMLSEIYKRTDTVWFYLYEVHRLLNNTETEIRMVTGSWGSGEENGELLYNGYKVSVWNDEKILDMSSSDVCTTMWMCLMPLIYTV